MDRFAERHRLLSYGLFSFYNKSDVPKRDKVTDYKEFILIVKKIWEVVAHELINREGGVVLDKFGYLAHWMSPKKKVYKVSRKNGVELMANFNTDGHFYHTALFSNIFNIDFFKGWSLDKSFSKKIKMGRFYKLNSGFKYKLFYSVVKRLYTNRFLNKLDINNENSK